MILWVGQTIKERGFPDKITNYLNQSYSGYYQLFKMNEVRTSFKKRWTVEEDRALRQIKENLRYKSWNIIAKKMSTDFGFSGRSQKQCRDRYQNYLRSKDNEFEWTQVQEEKMFKMFVRQGSKWELISSYFSNIKGIHIKNKFYTRVRKAIRQVNAVIEFYYYKKYTPFEFSVISKLVSRISNNVQELKYQKCGKDESQALDKYSKTLFHLIELTNQEDYELFPELQIKNSSPVQKKGLFKKLIKSLKKIEFQNFKQLKEENQINESSKAMMKCIQNGKNNELELFGNGEMDFCRKNQKIHCNYKMIENQDENYQSNLRIISRIKKIKPVQKPLRQEPKPTNNDFESQKFDQKEKQENTEKIMVEDVKQFHQLIDFNHFYPFIQEPPTYYDPGLQLSNVQLFYGFQ